MQQAAQQDGRGDRHQNDAKQRRQHREGVEVDVEGERADHGVPISERSLIFQDRCIFHNR